MKSWRDLSSALNKHSRVNRLREEGSCFVLFLFIGPPTHPPPHPCLAVLRALNRLLICSSECNWSSSEEDSRCWIPHRALFAIQTARCCKWRRAEDATTAPLLLMLLLCNRASELFADITYLTCFVCAIRCSLVISGVWRPCSQHLGPNLKGLLYSLS